MSRIARWVTPFLFVLTAAAAVPAQERVTVRIIHSNDLYGQMLRQGRPGDRRGGLAPRVHLIRELGRGVPTVVVDAGDAFAPGTLAAWDQGKTIAQALRRAGVVAMTPGNQDFAYGLEVLEQRRSEAGMSLLATNLTTRGATQLTIERTRMVEAGGVKVGLFGVVSPRLAQKINPKTAEGLAFSPVLPAAAEAVGALRDAGADYVVGLAHMSEPEALELAQKTDGLDLVVAGGYGSMDRPSRVPYLTRLVNHVHVVTTPRSGPYVGLVELQFEPLGEDGYRLSDVDADLLPVGETVPDDPVLGPMLKDLETTYAAETGESLGRLEGATLKAQAEAIANLMRMHAKAEVGIVNLGTFRGAVQGDTLRLRDVDRFIRFDDMLVEMDLTGKQLKAIARRSSSSGAGALAFSGLDEAATTVNRRPLQEDETYHVVTVEFLAEGGDGYDNFEKAAKRKLTNISIRSLTVAGLKTWGTLSAASFDDRSPRGIWRSGWAVEGAFRRNYIDQTTLSYRDQGERVSFLSGETSVAWNGASRYFLGYEVGSHVYLFENATDFGQIGSTFGDLETSTDRIDADLTYRYRTENLKVDPFVSSGVSTAFGSSDGERPFLIRGSAGFQFRPFTGTTVRFAGRAQRNTTAGENDYGAEIAVNYQTHLTQGSRFRSDLKSFIGFSDRRVVSIENYNTLSVPLVSGLSLIVRQNNFAYRVTKIQNVETDGIAFRTDLTVGFSYSLDWKWF